MLVCWWATIWTNAVFRFSRRACCGKFSSRVRLILIRFFRFFDCRLLCPVQERPTQATVRKISFLLCGGTYEQAVASICRKIWGSGSVRSSHQTVSDYKLRQRFPNTQQSWFLTGCRRLEKLVLPSIFWHKSFILHDEKLAELFNNNFERRNVTF